MKNFEQQINSGIVRILAATLLTAATSGILRAQFSEDYRDRNVDSLENLLLVAPPADGALLNIYWDLSWCYLYADDYGKMSKYSQLGVALALRLDSLYVAADLYNNLGVAYDYISEVDSAMFCFEQALATVARMEAAQVETSARIDKVKAITYGSIANLYSVQGKTSEALQYYFKALELFEKYGINNEIANILGNIGATYLDVDNYAQAETYLLKKEEICRRCGYEVNLAHALTGLSSVYRYNGDYARALSTAEEALGIYKKYDMSPVNLLFCHQCLSSAYLEGFGNDAKAMKFASLALNEAKQLEIPIEISRSLLLEAEIYLFRRNYAAAERVALEALRIDSTHLATNQSLYELVAKANAGLGNVDKASEYFDRFKQSQIAYANRHFQSQLSEMEVKYETEKKKLRIVMLEERARRRMWYTVAGGIILLFALAALFFAWLWTRQKRRKAELMVRQLEQEKQLVATQAVLDGETAERSRLARDLHDGLGGMLSAVKLNLNEMKRGATHVASDVAAFDAAIGMLDNSIHEMRRVAHHLMPDSLSRYGLKVALADFCNSISMAEFAYYGDEQRLDRKLEVVVYRIAHELVNNALKHAEARHIMVQIVKECDRLSLTVEDDGKGFDAAVATEGMGIQNIRTRVASFGGTLDLQSSAAHGTDVNVEFPLHDSVDDSKNGKKNVVARKKPPKGGIDV